MYRLDKFKKRKVAVIGDVMLDKYLFGSVKRISPEAPVPVLNVEREEFRLGGAANVAANISSLGGKAYLFGVVGNDREGRKLEELLNLHGIRFFPTYSKHTIIKTRVIGDRGYQLLRIDSEDTRQHTPMLLEQEILDSDIIVISDYAKGTITKELFKKLEKYGKRILVDPKPSNIAAYSNPFLITPNESEAYEISGQNLPESGRIIRDRFKSNVIVTRGAKGMVVFPLSGKEIEIPASSREVYDVSGAGDTVIATLALAIASGFSLEDAAILSNQAAGVVVEKFGTASIFASELEKKLFEEEEKIKTKEELKDIISRYKALGKIVVWTNGCFDLLHEGHVKYLKKAKELGDVLVVGLNSDSSVKKLKGPERPIRPQQARAEVLASLECVDYVVIFGETRATNILNYLKPDIYVKASDYNLENMDQSEREILQQYGAKIEFIPIEVEISTSKIVDKIRNQKK